MKVVHFERKHTAYSIEQLFADIREMLPSDIEVKVCESRFTSKGIWRRIYDIIRAARNQGDVNHITGDVHFLVYLLHKRKTILTIHDCGSLERLHGFQYWIYWFFWFWLPAKRCAVITVISEATKQELQRHLRSAALRIEVVPDCVSRNFQFQPHAFNAGCPRILQVGTTKNKNIDRVAEALAGLKCKLVVIGKLTTDQLVTLKQHNIDVENHFGLSRVEMVAQYHQADLVMFASLYEGFGLPILEANAVGRPVISSNLYSMPEVGGDAVCLVDPYDVGAIREAVVKIVNEPEYRNQLVKKGLKNVLRFSPEVVSQKYASLYRSVQNGKHKEAPNAKSLPDKRD